MNENKILAVVGLFGLGSLIWGGLVLFEPSSTLGTFFGLTGLALAFTPLWYLWTKDK